MWVVGGWGEGVEVRRKNGLWRIGAVCEYIHVHIDMYKYACVHILYTCTSVLYNVLQ